MAIKTKSGFTGYLTNYAFHFIDWRKNKLKSRFLNVFLCIFYFSSPTIYSESNRNQF